MPVEVGIWKLGQRIERVVFAPIDSEAKLEETLAKDILILSPNLMLIGRQVQTAHGGFIDLLAVDREGGLSVIELKKHRTPREVVAQALDYSSWVQGLSYDDIAEIYIRFSGGDAIEQDFVSFFHQGAPEKLNDSHEIIIVCSELDPSTERIINYLSETYGVPINAVFFRYFQQGGEDYLVRSWLIDPSEVVSRTDPKVRVPWNGKDFCVSFGEDETRNWEDAVQYGFISAGGGNWYSRTLQQLEPGHRVSVYIPQQGCVGVGIQSVKPVKDFTVTVDGRSIPILEAPLRAARMDHDKDNPELSEHLVGIEWIKTRAVSQAIKEPKMFANQNTVCKLRNRFTLERLAHHFGLADEGDRLGEYSQWDISRRT